MKYITIVANFFVEFGAALRYAMSGLYNFSKKWPGAVYPLLAVFLINILTIFVFDVKDTIYQPLSAMLLWSMIGLQWLSLRKQIAARNKTRTEDDKQRLAGFFEAAGLNGIPGSIRFLSPVKEKWYNPIAWYRRIKGILLDLTFCRRPELRSRKRRKKWFNLRRFPI